jgi:GDP-L-fucose synthase
MVNTNVLEAGRINGVQKLVYTSSIGAYADAEFLTEENARPDTIPMSFAGWAKRMAELQIYAYKMQHGLKSFAIVRLGAIYGPGDNFDKDTAMVIPALISRIYEKEKPLVVWGDGSAVRDFMYSTDAAEGIIRAFHFGTDGEIVNIASGKGTSIKEIVEGLRSFLEFEYKFDTTKPSGAPRRVMDISKARKLLGFEPSVDLVSGLKKTWEWFVAHPNDHKRKLNYFEEAPGEKK